jgi:CRP/FNR family cyclic AMP-dependent transcriptional regulator
MVDLVANASVLKSVPPFSALPEHELAALFHAVQNRTYARKACIVRAGDGAGGLYAVLSGSVKFLMEDPNGRQVSLAVLGAGEFFSELEVAGCAALSVVALRPCEVLYVSERDFSACTHDNSAVARLLSQKLSARLREAYAKIASFAFLDVRERVAQTLCERATWVDGLCVVDHGSEEIARSVGASREMVSRVITQLCEQRLVRRQRRRTIILDCDRLAAMAIPGTKRHPRERHAAEFSPLGTGRRHFC